MLHKQQMNASGWHMEIWLTYWLSESLPLRFLGMSGRAALKAVVLAALGMGFMRLGPPQATHGLPSTANLSGSENTGSVSSKSCSALHPLSSSLGLAAVCVWLLCLWHKKPRLHCHKPSPAKSAHLPTVLQWSHQPNQRTKAIQNSSNLTQPLHFNSPPPQTSCCKIPSCAICQQIKILWLKLNEN